MGSTLPAPRARCPAPRLSPSATVTDERETLTYELFGTAARELAGQVVEDG